MVVPLLRQPCPPSLCLFNADPQSRFWYQKRIHGAPFYTALMEEGAGQVISHVTCVFYSLLQVLSDVFNAPVYTMDLSNSTCLGSAYRALHSNAHTENRMRNAGASPPSWAGGRLRGCCSGCCCLSGVAAESGLSFADVVKNALEPRLAVTPNPRAQEVPVSHTHTHSHR